MQGTLEYVFEMARAVMASLAISYEVDQGFSINEDELKCMAENIYFEGRAEPMTGKVAIGNVVMNRVASNRHPDTICEVVHEGPHRESWKTRGKDVPDSERIYWPIRNKCDFSWYCDGKSDAIMLTDYQGRTIQANMDAWVESIKIARMALEGTLPDLTQGATHYFNPSLANPKWQYAFTQVAIIDNHTFFVH